MALPFTGTGIIPQHWSRAVPVTWQAGDTNRLEVTGSASPVTLTMYRNGSPVLTTSTSVYVKADGSPGIGINSPSVPGLALDNWEGGNMSSLKTVTVAGITANDKVYDGTTTATISTNGYTLSGVDVGDVGNVILATNGYLATFASAGANNGILVTVSGLTLTGSAANKYTLTQPTGLTANITAKPLTALGTLSVPASKVYDGTTATVTPAARRHC